MPKVRGNKDSQKRESLHHLYEEYHHEQSINNSYAVFLISISPRFTECHFNMKKFERYILLDIFHECSVVFDDTNFHTYTGEFF